jgi:hypothetical protein
MPCDGGSTMSARSTTASRSSTEAMRTSITTP